MLIKLNDHDGNRYRYFLQLYRQRTNKEPGLFERTEAFFCARSENPWNTPYWI